MDDQTLAQRLRVLFLEELQDGISHLRSGTATLTDPVGADVVEVQRELFRLAHSLKGAAHSAHVPAAVTLCHRLEESFAQVQAGSRALGAGFFDEVESQLDALADIERELRGGPVATPAAAAAPLATQPRLRVTVGAVDELVAEVTDLIDLLSRSAVAERSIRQAASRLVTTTQGLRLQPFVDACVGLQEAATDVARAGGKQVDLVVEGGHMQVDRAVAAALREPLLHLVRNAVDHGIETPAVRHQAGKPPGGRVVVSATVVDGTLELTVADDGGGVDVGALRQAAERGGLPAVDDVLELAFAPGVSTARQLTTVSGRGVGLDAVRQRVERLGGALRFTSTSCDGTSIAFAVPATLATLRVLLVQAGAQPVAVPLSAVERVQEVERSALRELGGATVLLGDHEPVPVVFLGAALGLDAAAPSSRTAVLVRLRASAGGGALEVDRVDDELEAVLRPLPARVAGVPGVLGVVNAANGSLALVTNPATCLRWGLARPGPQAVAEPTGRSSRVLLAEDSLTTRALERSILESAGYAVVTAVDGTDAWQLLQREHVDVVVSDVDMPGMSGVELCRAIRGSGRFPQLPVVLVTSLGSREDRLRGAEAGADAYLVKSAFDRQLLLDTLERLL